MKSEKFKCLFYFIVPLLRLFQGVAVEPDESSLGELECELKKNPPLTSQRLAEKSIFPVNKERLKTNQIFCLAKLLLLGSLSS